MAKFALMYWILVIRTYFGVTLSIPNPERPIMATKWKQTNLRKIQVVVRKTNVNIKFRRIRVQRCSESLTYVHMSRTAAEYIDSQVC